MSQAVFPSLPGLMWNVIKAPAWSTKVQQAVSGKELRAQYFSRPIYRWTLSYEILRQATAFAEFQTLIGFFNARQGMFDSFLYIDPVDNLATAQNFGTGDGVTTAFQLVRTFGGNNENVYDVGGAQAQIIYRQDWQGNQQLYFTSRTNNCLRSYDFSNAIWIKTNCTVTTGISDPSGGTGACTLTATAANGEANQNLGNSTAIVRTNSIWMRRRTGVGTVSVQGPDSAAVPVAVTGSWQRFVVTGASSLFRRFDIILATSGDAVDVFDAQQEDSAFATAFIPTVDVPITVTDYTLSATGLVTFATAPLLAAILTWSGSYYWRVRFDIDQAEFTNFLSQLWEAKKITLVSVK